MAKSTGAPTHYQILKVKPTATEEKIRDAYRRLAKKYHPDVCKEPLALEYFKSITEAFNVLKDPARRKAYDAELVMSKFTETARPAPPPEMQKVYKKIVRAVEKRKMDPVEAVFDILGSFIEPNTSINIPLPGNIKLKLSSKQLRTIVTSADVVVQGLRRSRKK